MMPLNEPLLPVEANDDKLSSQFRLPTRVEILSIGLALTVGLTARPHLATQGSVATSAVGAAAEPTELSGPLGLGGVFGSVGVFLGSIYAVVAPWSMLITFIGILLYCLPFLLFGKNHAQDFNGFAAMMEGFGLPLPKVFAAGGLVSLILGPILMLTMAPVCVIIGSKLICLFLLFSTYYGHIIPLRKAAAGSPEFIGNFIMVLKNTGLFGLALMMGFCAGLEVFPKMHTYCVVGRYFGLVLFVVAFLMPAWNHAKDFNGFVGMMKAFGLPVPVFWAVGGLFSLFAGGLLLLSAKPVLMEWGAELIALFLIGSTYFGHYKPMKAATPGSTDYIMNFLNTFKNIGLFGGCLVIIGCSIPAIPSAASAL